MGQYLIQKHHHLSQIQVQSLHDASHCGTYEALRNICSEFIQPPPREDLACFNLLHKVASPTSFPYGVYSQGELERKAALMTTLIRMNKLRGREVDACRHHTHSACSTMVTMLLLRPIYTSTWYLAHCYRCGFYSLCSSLVLVVCAGGVWLRILCAQPFDQKIAITWGGNHVAFVHQGKSIPPWTNLLVSNIFIFYLHWKLQIMLFSWL